MLKAFGNQSGGDSFFCLVSPSENSLAVSRAESSLSVIPIKSSSVGPSKRNCKMCVQFHCSSLIFSESFLYLCCLQGEQTLWVLMALDNFRNFFHKLLLLAPFAASSSSLFSKDILLVIDTFALLFSPAGFLSGLRSLLCDTPHVLLSLQTSC